MIKIVIGVNDLATTHPDLAKEAYGWDPTTVIAGTSKKLQWKCKNNHVWFQTGHHRSRDVGCPFCRNIRVWPGFNDLATTHPDLVKEAYGWDPTTVMAGTHKKLKWKCKLNHIWEVTGKSRISGNAKGSSCPYCLNLKVWPGFNDLATTHPEIAKEANGWDPKLVVAGSEKKLGWKCKNEHTWNSQIDSRAKYNRGCPYCSNLKVWPGFNDLATTHPDLAKEAYGWDPRKQTAGTNKKVKWKCSQGHIWQSSSHSRLTAWKNSANKNSGTSGCPTCSFSGFDPNKSGYLYFLIQPKWELYQVGITNFPKDRLRNHKKNGFTLIELRGPMDGHTAKELERTILTFLKSQKADLSPEHVVGRFDGHTESWTIDSYKVNNLKELIDKASEAGF